MESTSVFQKDLFKDKVVLITGGSRGGMLQDIGKRFLQHGAKCVVLMSRNKENNEKVAKILSEWGQCMSEPGDVSKESSCQKVVEKVKEQLGRIDVLVNGAAGNFLATSEKLSTNAIRRVLEIDTLGTFNMSKTVYNHCMKSQGSGVIINISASLHWNGSWGQAHSSAAKAGVDALTRVLACEWGPSGVRVVGVVPGPIQGTEGFHRLADINNINNKTKTNNSMQQGDSNALQHLKVIMPVQRFGHVNDISNCVLFIASPAASFVTGTNFVVDGGQYLTYPNILFSQNEFVKMWANPTAKL